MHELEIGRSERSQLLAQVSRQRLMPRQWRTAIRADNVAGRLERHLPRLDIRIDELFVSIGF
jgi:hypothetical protein